MAIYKADFEAERKSREELNDRCLELAEKFRLLERQFVEQGFNPNPLVNPLPLPAPPNPVNPFPVAIDPEVSSMFLVQCCLHNQMQSVLWDDPCTIQLCLNLCNMHVSCCLHYN